MSTEYSASKRTISSNYDMHSFQEFGSAKCRVCYPNQNLLPPKHDDRSRRRQSSNADILESIGLPTTGSFHDMKSLQGSTLYDVPRENDSRCNTAKSLSKMVKKVVKAAGEKTSHLFDKTPRKKFPRGKSIMLKLRKREQEKQQLSLLDVSRAESLEADGSDTGAYSLQY